MTDPTPSIAVALAAVMADCTNVAKRERNDHFNFQFRGIDAILNAVGPVLRTHHVVVLPRLVNITYEVRGKSTAVMVIVDYAFVGPAGDELVCRVPGEALDTQDKGTAKAMSVAFRVALIQALALPTDEPDPDSHGPYDTTTRQEPQRQAPPVQPSPLDAVRMQTFNRYRASVDAGATQAQFVAVIEQEFAQPFADVTAEQLNGFGQAKA